MFKGYQVDIKDMKWWEKHETMFSIVGFPICQMLEILDHKLT
jgi:hypothetical protein